MHISPKNPEQNDILEGAGLAKQILSTSLSMIGFCTTLIGLVKVVETHVGPSHVDEFAAIVLQLFLLSAGTSYWSLRSRNKKRPYTLFLR